MAFLGQINRERNKVSNFGEPSPTSVKITNKYMVAWDKLTHPCLK